MRKKATVLTCTRSSGQYLIKESFYSRRVFRTRKQMRPTESSSETGNEDVPSYRLKWAERAKQEHDRRKRLRMKREQQKEKDMESNGGVSKHGNALCADQYRESLDCISAYGRGSSICERPFNIYKDCIKKQQALRIAANGGSP